MKPKLQFINPLFKNGRYLFIREGCPYCSIYKDFIRLLNSQLPVNKMVNVIDCTSTDRFGILDNKVIELFAPYITGYPVIFLEGRKIEGANTREECEVRIKSMLYNDFFEDPNISEYMFNRSCKYIKGRLICN